MTLDAMLAESVEEAKRRERKSFSTVLDSVRKQVVLVGAGKIGRSSLSALRRINVAPLAFADSHQALRGLNVEGMTVLSLEEAAGRFGAKSLFVVAVFHGAGDGSTASTQRELMRLGCRKVTSFLPLAWQCAPAILEQCGTELPSAILAGAADLARVNALFADEHSRDVLVGQLGWRLRGDASDLRTDQTTAFCPADLFTVREEDVFIDAGAGDGQTYRALNGRFARAWLIEADRDKVSQLKAATGVGVTVVECALGAGRTDPGAGWPVFGGAIRTETLDTILGNESPSVLKLNLGGGEATALEGARSLLTRCRPIVAAGVAAGTENLWRIPLLLNEMLPGHRIFLRTHQSDGCGLVVYAVPPDRAV